MILLQQLSGEEKILYARFQDAVRAATQRSQTKFIGFLDLRQQEILRATVAAEHFDCWQLAGGFDGAERKVAGFFPEYIDDPQDQAKLFPFTALTASFREQDKLTHRDFLGSLMGLKISREMIGDILVGSGSATFFLMRQACPVVLDELKKVGRVGISLTEGASHLQADAPTILPLAGTLSSKRLDAVTAFLTRSSREQAQQMIRRELVKVNGEVLCEVSASVEERDLVSVRGYGKFVIRAFDGITKKGRLRIAAGHYQ